MAMQLKKGDYVPDGRGGFLLLSGGEDLLQRILFKLTVRRASFPLLPELGSKLYRLPGERVSDQETMAKQYVEEALIEEEGLEVKTVSWDRGSGKLGLELVWKTQEISTSLMIKGM